MGSSHSSPGTTVHIANPVAVAVELTSEPQILKESLEDKSDKCQLKEDVQGLQKRKFLETLRHIEMLSGKPVFWSQHCQSNLDKMKRDLIQCLKDHPREILCCNEKAQEYYTFVFCEQYKVILNSIHKPVETPRLPPSNERRDRDQYMAL